MAVQRDLGAQALWHLDILLTDPLDIEVHEASEREGAPAFEGSIRVPKVGHFLIQKGLIHQRRTTEEKIKDLFYVFDLIDTETGLSDRAIHDMIEASERGRAGEVNKFIKTLAGQFDSPGTVTRILEQYAPDSRPNARYLRDEARQWFGALSTAVSP